MILSPYHNPSYRTPTSRPYPSATPPPRQSSQRPDTLTSTATPGESSPRTRVAERLQELDLRHVQVRREDRTSDSSPRKRVKRHPARQEDETDVSFDGSDPASAGGDPSVSSTVGPSPALEIGETPASHPGEDKTQSALERPHSPVRSERRRASTPPISPSPLRSRKRAAPSINDDIETGVDRTAEPALHRPSSPGPPPLSPHSIGFDRAALTWQDDEITGHLIDDSSLDDDGEGINGIGFRPTPAIAYARQQKRRQQVSDWKAREARVERQKRLERRRGAAASERSGKAVVRFE